MAVVSGSSTMNLSASLCFLVQQSKPPDEVC